MSADVTGELFAAGASRGEPARLCATAAGLELVTAAGGEALAPSGLALSPRLSGVARRLTLADGRVFVSADDDALEALLRASGGRVRGRHIAAMERWRPRLLAIVTLLVMAVLVGLRWGLPAAADALAQAVPASAEAAIGANSLDVLDAVLLAPSRLDAETGAAVDVLFAELLGAADARPGLRLEQRAGELIGANALALPGGPVVVTDELVRLAPSEDALAAVLAHEITHVEARHGLRRMLRAAGMALIITVAIGDTGELVEEAAGLPALLLDRSYSRAFESDADEGAIAIMRATGRDPAALADLLAKLDTAGAAGKPRSWLATHPSTVERIARLRAAGATP